MGLISTVIDRFTAGQDSGKRIEWYTGWGDGANMACIMGAIGIVMHNAEFQKEMNEAFPDDKELHEFKSLQTDFIWMYNPKLWEKQELNELWAFFTTICEQHPEWIKSILFPEEESGTMGVVEECFQSAREYQKWQSPVLTTVINTCIRFNDGMVKTFEDDLLPILEKTALRIAEQV